MENEKEKRQPKKQCFYFNDEGQKFYFDKDGRLVVESNKGVWVDGEKYVKMYGNFSCNAKTMGEIIHHLKGIKVDIEESTKDKDFFQLYLNAAKELLKMQEEKSEQDKKARQEKTELTDELTRIEIEKESILRDIRAYNRLPWWKRMFKKIEVK